MRSTQEELETGVGTDAEKVWVVVGNFEDDPHPKVLGVYDTDEAAEKHHRDLRDQAFGPVAWGMHEMEVRSER